MIRRIVPLSLLLMSGVSGSLGCSAARLKVESDSDGGGPESDSGGIGPVAATDGVSASGDADPEAPARCAPSGGGPYWIQEGETVTALVQCSVAGSGAQTFTLGDVPTGAQYNSATASLTWKTNLSDAGVYHVRVTAAPSGESGEIKIGVADRFFDPANLPIKDATIYTEEMGLPVFHLQATPELEENLMVKKAGRRGDPTDGCNTYCYSDPYAPVAVTYRGHVYNTQGHYRGASSLYYPKHSFTLNFDKTDKFTEPLLAGGRMQKRRHVVLISTFDDNSYVRQQLAFEMWNRLDPGSMRLEHFGAVVYLNGQYYGLYAVLDQPTDGAVMEANGLSKDSNVYMAISHDGNFDPQSYDSGLPTPRLCPYQGYDKRGGSPEQCVGPVFVPAAFDDLIPLLDFVTKSPDADFNKGIGKVIEMKDYIRWFVHATAIKAGDSFEKNAYHYHDPLAGGPWRMLLWDFNDSFGQDWTSSRRPPDDDQAGAPVGPFGTDYVKWPNGTNTLWTRLWKDPTYGPQMKARYIEALASELSLANVLAAFESLVSETAASARRDERKWGPTYRMYYGPTHFGRTDFTTYVQEIQYTRKWINDRWQHLQSLYH